jgi:hypothetical protein
MSETERIPEPWNSFLRELDHIATDPVDFHCIGGFVLTQKYGFNRQTRDIDVLSIIPSTQLKDFLDKGGEGSELHRKYKVYLDRVTVIQYYPEDYDQRLAEMYAGQLRRIRLYAPDACDLALMKLGRNIERDRDDVKFLARQGFITAEGIKRRYQQEMRPYVALPEHTTDDVLNLWVEMIEEEMKKIIERES